MVLDLLFRVYPRTHGGTLETVREHGCEAGLSPHTRGNPSRQSRHRGSAGSIPAHTGEPQFGLRADDPHRVYPRTHGGTAANVSAPVP